MRDHKSGFVVNTGSRRALESDRICWNLLKFGVFFPTLPKIEILHVKSNGPIIRVFLWCARDSNALAHFAITPSRAPPVPLHLVLDTGMLESSRGLSSSHHGFLEHNRA